MARPEGITKKGKDNSHKKFREREEWMETKKKNRPRQVWVWEVEPYLIEVNEFFEIRFPGSGGHWEKVQ